MARKPQRSVTGRVKAAMAEHDRQLPRGIVSVKLIATIVTVVVSTFSVGGLGSYYGTRQAAPDPESVKQTSEDVGRIRTELTKLNTTLEAFMRSAGEARTSDRAEFDRRLNDQQRAIDKLDALADKARKVDDLERRIAALEKAGK